MKKILTLAAVALCAFAAQAVTLKWSSLHGDTIPNSVPNSGATPILSNSTATAVSITCVLTLKNVNGQANFMGAKVGTNSDVDTYGFRILSNDTKIYATQNTNTTGNGSYTPTLNTPIALTLVFDGTYVGFWANDTRIRLLDYTLPSDPWNVYAGVWNNSSYVDQDTISMAVYEGALTAEEVATIASTKNVAALPEPTVLALLALGVAGLTLKRKIA